jgi:hypothetical protein
MHSDSSLRSVSNAAASGPRGVVSGISMLVSMK